MSRRLFAPALILLAACPATLPLAEAPDPYADLRGLPLVEAFEAVAEEQGVPADLLLALAWQGSSFTLPDPDEEHDHGPAAIGHLGLSEERLRDAAEATGLDPEEARQDWLQSLSAGAAWLREHADPDADPLLPGAGWWPAVRALPGFEEPWLADEFALQVFDTLQRGLEIELPDGGALRLPPRELPDLEDVDVAEGPGLEEGDFAAVRGYPGRARYLPAHPNGNGGPRPTSIRRVVIHTIEGSYEGGISWARNPSSNAGFQYIIRRSDGEVTQMVPDDVMGWHACNNNADTIGIEHEGHASAASTWTAAQLEASARLTGWLARRYDIPVDRNHIVGHGEIQPSGCAYRYDPGPHFPWAAYMQKVAWYKANGWRASDAPSPRLHVDLPRDGQQVGTPFLTRVRTRNVHHVSIHLGARRMAGGLRDALVDRSIRPARTGWKRLQVRAFDAQGVRLAKKTLRVRVRRNTMELQPAAEKIHGLDTRLTTTTTGEPAWVRYWTNGGRGVRDLQTDRLRAQGAEFPLIAGFSNPGRKLVLARAYRADGRLVSEGWTWFEADEADGEPAELHELGTLPMPGTRLLVTVDADPAVAWVRYKVDGQWAEDAVSGADRATGPEYGMVLQFDAAGPHEVRAKAFDAAGNPRSTLVQTVEAPGDGLFLEAERLAPLRWVLDASAPAGTERVLFYDGTTLLRDRVTGLGYAPGPGFELEVDFGAPGTRVISAVARDPLGNILGTAVLTVEAN